MFTVSKLRQFIYWTFQVFRLSQVFQGCNQLRYPNINGRSFHATLFIVQATYQILGQLKQPVCTPTRGVQAKSSWHSRQREVACSAVAFWRGTSRLNCCQSHKLINYTQHELRVWKRRDPVISNIWKWFHGTPTVMLTDERKGWEEIQFCERDQRQRKNNNMSRSNLPEHLWVRLIFQILRGSEMDCGRQQNWSTQKVLQQLLVIKWKICLNIRELVIIGIFNSVRQMFTSLTKE